LSGVTDLVDVWMADGNKNSLTSGDELTQLRNRVNELEVYGKFYDRFLIKLRNNTLDINLINQLSQLFNKGVDTQVVCKVFAEHINKLLNSETSVFILSSDHNYLIQQNNPFTQQKTKQISNLLGFNLPYLKIHLKNSKIYSTFVKTGLPSFTNEGDVIQLMTKESLRIFKIEEKVQQLHNILGYNSVLTYPLVSNNETIGLIEISSKIPFPENVLKRLEFIADLLTAFIKGALSEKKLSDNEKMYHQLVELTGIGNYKDDIRGNLLYYNNKFLQILGYSHEEVKEKSIQDFIHTDDIKKFNEYRNSILTEKMDQPANNFRAINKEGKVILIKVEIEPIFENGETIGTHSYLWDISDRKLRAGLISPDLFKKDFMVKELNHRVKNNMAVISSLLDLQSKTVTDEKTLAILQESRNRIRSMSLIHEKLYLSTDISKVNFSDYIKELSFELFNLYNINVDLINLKVDITSTPIELDYAIPCGLIINEMISNSLKYAFEEGKPGEINIKFDFKEKNFVLIIKDNGIGFPPGIDFHKTETMGMQLICTLVDQLEGDINLIKDKGTVFKITFPIINSSS
jgi:PAS domain S-box-containing protein